MSCGQFHYAALEEVIELKKYVSQMAAGILAAGIMSLGVLIGSQVSKQPDPASAVDTAPVAAVESTSAPEEYMMVPVGTVAIPGYDTITLKAEKRTQTVALVNPLENDCAFVISILLPDGTELYKSGLIAPGSEIDSIKLSTAPAAGTYENAILRYSCWSESEDGTLVEVNGADTICTLEVEP